MPAGKGRFTMQPFDLSRPRFHLGVAGCDSLAQPFDLQLPGGCPFVEGADPTSQLLDLLGLRGRLGITGCDGLAQPFNLLALCPRFFLQLVGFGFAVGEVGGELLNPDVPRCLFLVASR